QIFLTRKVSCRHVCRFVSRQLNLMRRIALAKDQRARKPSAAPSFAQAQTKSWISSDVAVLGSNSSANVRGMSDVRHKTAGVHHTSRRRGGRGPVFGSPPSAPHS